MEKTYKFYVKTNRMGSIVEDKVTLEIPDGLTEEQEERYVEKNIHEMVMEKIDWGFEEI